MCTTGLGNSLHFSLQSPGFPGAELPGSRRRPRLPVLLSLSAERWSQYRRWVVIGKFCSQNEGGPFLLVGTTSLTDTHCRWEEEEGTQLGTRPTAVMQPSHAWGFRSVQIVHSCPCGLPGMFTEDSLTSGVFSAALNHQIPGLYLLLCRCVFPLTSHILL